MLFALRPIARQGAKRAVDFTRAKYLPQKAYEATRGAFATKNLVKTSSLLKRASLIVLIYMGFCAVIDWANKRQRANLEPNATTKNGKEYKKVNMGKKLGAILGVFTYGTLMLSGKKYLSKILTTFKERVSTVISGLPSSIIIGFILGAITDKISNKQVAKEADKAAT